MLPLMGSEQRSSPIPGPCRVYLLAGMWKPTPAVCHIYLGGR